MQNRQILYKKVMDYIMGLVSSGEVAVGDLIPSEAKMMKLLGVSVGTVRKAIDVLVAQKLLYRHHGKGTYVSSRDFDNSMFNFFSYGTKSGLAVRIYKTTPVRKKITASHKICKELQLPKGSKVIYLERIGYVNSKQPVMFEQCWLSAEIVDGLEQRNLHIPDLLYMLIAQKFDAHVVYSTETLTADIADKKTADILKTPIKNPVMVLTRKAYTHHKKILEFRITQGRSDMFSYTTTIGQLT